MKDTVITAAGHQITLTGETRTFATIAIDSREYTGEVGNPVGKLDRGEWIDGALLCGLNRLPESEFVAVCDALESAMR